MITAIGERSSWLASATKRRSRSKDRRSRSSIALSVSPSRRISSRAGASGSRSDSPVSEISDARRRMFSTGLSPAVASA